MRSVTGRLYGFDYDLQDAAFREHLSSRLSEKSLEKPRQRVFGSVKPPEEAPRSRFVHLAGHLFATQPDFSDGLSGHSGEYRCLTRREPEGTRYRTSARAPESSASPPESAAVAVVAETRASQALPTPR
jgi:hypothetical protein